MPPAIPAAPVLALADGSSDTDPSPVFTIELDGVSGADPYFEDNVNDTSGANIDSILAA